MLRQNLIYLAAGVAMLGCSRTFVPPPPITDHGTVLARYLTGACRDLETGASVQSPATTYALVKQDEFQILVERDIAGTGVEITNGWMEDGAKQYFWRSPEGLGLLFSFPADRSESGTRLSYRRMKVDHSSGVQKPAGKPRTSCELVPAPSGASVSAEVVKRKLNELRNACETNARDAMTSGVKQLRSDVQNIADEAARASAQLAAVEELSSPCPDCDRTCRAELVRLWGTP